jgi:AcrR family transcriptional regulator
MTKAAHTAEAKRRIPRQARARASRDAILEAAIQILERGGLDSLTTNAVAAGAGVSIGTLYQYFDGKDAILIEIARRETAGTMQAALRALGDDTLDKEARTRAMIRAVVQAFGGRQRARKAVVMAILARGLREEFVGTLAGFTDALGERIVIVHGMPMPREQLFVATRAVMGAIRAAVLEEQPFFTSRAFEDELVRLVMSYLSPPPTAG